jgi:hypothetical protein
MQGMMDEIYLYSIGGKVCESLEMQREFRVPHFVYPTCVTHLKDE